MDGGLVHEDGDDAHGGNGEVHDAERLINFARAQHEDGDAETRKSSAEALSNIGPAAASVAAALSKRADRQIEGNAEVRRQAAIALGRIGAVEALNKTGAGFTEGDQAFVQMLTGPLTVAVRTVRMFEDAERLTITDDLTKLYNYRYLMQYL